MMRQMIARVQDAAQNANQHTDFIMMNQYFGSWAGPAEGLAPALERVRRMFPDKMVVISEFSLAGLFAPDTAQADRMRALIMESQLAEFARHDFVAGAVFWCYQDYKSHRNLWPGLTSDWVEMGLVDEHRQRLPSYAAWQERTSPARRRGGVAGDVLARDPPRAPRPAPDRVHSRRADGALVGAALGRAQPGGSEEEGPALALAALRRGGLPAQARRGGAPASPHLSFVRRTS